MLGTLRWMLGASGVVAMLVGVFLIQHTVSTAIRRRNDDLVTLRAIGATRGSIVAGTMLEALAIGAVGSLAGAALGMAFAKVAVRAFGDAVAAMYATLPPPPVTITAGELAATLAVGEGAVFLGALVPSLRLIRMRPAVVRPPIAAPTGPAPTLPLAAGGVAALAVGLAAGAACGSLGFAGGVSALAAFAGCVFLSVTLLVPAAPDELIERWHPGTHDRRARRVVVVSDTLAERFDLEVGDSLSIPAPLAPLDVTVGAVRADYLLDLGSVTVPWPTFVRHFGRQGANILFVDEAGGLSAAELKRRIAGAIGTTEATVLTLAELRAMTDALIDQSFALTTGLQLLAMLVTVLAMVNATSATILDRAFDLATWRAVGMERRRLVRLLIVEASLMGLLAGMLGVAAGSLVGGMLVRVVAPEVTGFRMALDWPAQWAPVVIVATMLFAGATAWSVAKTRMPRRIVLRERRA